MILNENESANIFEPDSPMDVAVFNFAYRLYLDGTYAASEEEQDKVARKFIAYIEQRSEQEKFFLICDLFDRLHAVDLANHLLTADPQAKGESWPDAPESGATP